MKTFRVLQFVILILLLSATGCEEVVIEKTFTPGNEANFSVNQLYTSANGQLSVKITEVGDSRCPEGVYCIWAGEVSIKGEWTNNGTSSDFEIHSVISDLNKQPDGFTISIVDAKPYPKYGVDSDPENLTITLLILKN